jgi:biopolymer transport protein ExbD
MIYCGNKSEMCLNENHFMTDIQQLVSQNHKGGVRRMIKSNMRIDMTPMVDLGFLLISFFVITTELTKPKAMELFMPKDGTPVPLGESNALTVLLDDNKIYYYNGKWEDAVKKKEIYQTYFSGKNNLRGIINTKQQQLDSYPGNKEGRNGLMILIKPSENASYKNVVDILDEMTINEVKKYAVIKISGEERTWLKEQLLLN